MILTFLHKISVRVSTLCMRNGWLHAAIMLVWLTVCTVATAQDAQRPLAYIRRLAVAPAVLATLPAEAPKPAPKGASRAEREAWDRREAARQGLARLRSASAAILTSALVERLRGEPGLAIARIEGNETARRLWRHAEEGASPPGEPEIGRDPSGLILPASDQVIAAIGQDKTGLTREAADLLYHLLVLLESRSVTWSDVSAELERRMGKSGLVEKAQRGGGDNQ